MNIEAICRNYIKKKYKLKSSKDIQATLLAGDASSRRYLDVRFEDQSMIVCLTNPEDQKQNEDFVFWQSEYEKRDVLVPKIYHYEKGYILQENLGSKTLLNDQSYISELDLIKRYEKTIDSLIKIQRIPTDLKPDIISFDDKKLNFEIDFTRKYFIEKFLKVEKSTALEISKSFDLILQNLLTQNTVTTHRDFHSKNIMINEKSEIVVIDFQDTMLGVAQYDLCSLLDDCYTAIAGESKIKLLKYYWNKTKDLEGFYKYDDYKNFMKVYNYTKIQRLYKAIGSFTYHWETKNNPFYLKYVGHAMEKIKLTLNQTPELESLRKLLLGAYYEN